MDFSLTPNQIKIQSSVLELASSLANDVVSQDESSTFNREDWLKIAQSDLLRGFAPKEYGGLDWDITTRVAALEAFGKGCIDNGLCLALSSLVWTILPPILSVGSETQKSEYIPKLISGELIAADGITEEHAGSDVMAMQTTATSCPEGYRIEGEKCHIGFAPIADLVILFLKTDPDSSHWGVSTFLVPTNIEGVFLSKNSDKMGLRTLPMGSISFKNCVVPKSARLGDEGIGMSLFNESMEWERAFILATQVGAMARQLDRCIAYSKTRKQFGKSISDYQSISNRIADMRIRLETCQLHLYKCAWLKDQGKTAALEASIAKLCISESFAKSSLDSIRIHGAKGYLTEYQIERDFRDATGGLIYAGTSDIQRNLIARLTGL